jgi:iron complex outermembrane receptor protein
MFFSRSVEEAPHVDRHPSEERPTTRRKQASARRSLALAAAAFALFSGTAAAQEPGRVAGTVIDNQGAVLEEVFVSVRGLDAETMTDQSGRFSLELDAGEYVVRFSRIGFRTEERRVSVEPGMSMDVQVRLQVRPVEAAAIEVSVLRPDLQPIAQLEERELSEANLQDPGESLRLLQGNDAVRRGPLGLDPAVRGLRETEVGAYIDGARVFPGGPARMDSQLGHVDPTSMAKMQVVQGPYALTWGAGNLTAIRVETPEFLQADGVSASLGAGFDSNRNAADVSGTLSGRGGGVAYWTHGAYRTGNSYKSGDGTEIPADFTSGEGRVKLGFDTGTGSLLTLSGGYQGQGPVEFAGRLLNAKFFHVPTASARWQLERAQGVLSSFDVQGYFGKVTHGMTNDGKPTAEDNPDRIPPFALDVGADAESTTWGGRAAASLRAANDWSFEVGGDYYLKIQNALRTVERQSNNMLLFEDVIWPDAHISDGGLFGKATKAIGENVSVSASIRLDLVSASGDSSIVSDFFLENTVAQLDQSETNFSAAVSAAFALSRNWTLSLGVGSVVRTADALERYSVRFPASKAQMANEVLGDPGLAPERSTQGDIWLDAAYERVTFSFNGFYRGIDDYITLIPDEDLPKRLPLSPLPVYRYINGNATYWGLETSASFLLSHTLTLMAGVDYLWGEDTFLEEPALGVTPFGGSLGLRYDHPGDRWYLQGLVQGRADQDRVATIKGEVPTEGYALGDIRGGVLIFKNLLLDAGVENFWNQQYVNHLNTKNPFNGQQIPEPGIIFFVNLAVFTG